jgi:hypothetical protein
MQNTGTSYFAFEHSLCMGQKAPFLVNLIPPLLNKQSVFIFKLKLANIKETAPNETSGTVTPTK